MNISPHSQSQIPPFRKSKRAVAAELEAIASFSTTKFPLTKRVVAVELAVTASLLKVGPLKNSFIQRADQFKFLKQHYGQHFYYIYSFDLLLGGGRC